MLNKRAKEEIKRHALEECPNECCGLLVEREEDVKVFRCNNSSTEKTKYFKISPADYLKASSKGKIKASYHSHCADMDGFSMFDKQNSQNHKIEYILYCTKSDNFFSYKPNCKFNSYVGRRCVIGKQDCGSLVREFYQKELNIYIRDYHRDESWIRNPTDTFDRYYEAEGFHKVHDLKKYDCIFFKLKKTGPSSHIAIYLGNDLILHQPGGVNGYSRIEEYSPRWKKFTNYTIRHKDL